MENLEEIRNIEPFCLCGNVYFIGTRAVSVHLIDTGAGLLLIDTGYPFMREAITENMRLLGFDPKDIRAIVHSHGHYDHYGNTGYLKSLSGATTYISRIDNDIVNGTLDLSWATELGHERITPFDCDVLLADGDAISLGNVRIICRLAPGHTAGTFCLFFETEDGGRRLRCAMHGGVGTNSMERAFLEKYGLGTCLRERFRADLEALKSERVDVVLGNHPDQNDTEGKLARLRAGDADAFIDPTEWARFMDECASRYDRMIAAEQKNGIE